LVTVGLLKKPSHVTHRRACQMVAMYLLRVGPLALDWRQSPIRARWRTITCDAGRSIILGTSRVMTYQELAGAVPLSRYGTRSFRIR